MGVKLVSASAGSVEIVAPATASNFVATMPAGTGTVSVNGVSSNIVSGIVQASTSGTSINFTGIPSWVKRITVMFAGLSTNGTSLPQIQLGDSGGVETTSYAGATWQANTTNTAHSTGFLINAVGNAAYVLDGIATLCLLNATTNLWVYSVVGGNESVVAFHGGGQKTLSGTLDRVRITTVNGTDAFDAGSINILYE